LAARLSERHFRDTVRRLGIGNPDDSVLQIYLVPLHWRQLLIDPKSGLRDDADNIAQVARRRRLDPKDHAIASAVLEDVLPARVGHRAAAIDSVPARERCGLTSTP